MHTHTTNLLMKKLVKSEPVMSLIAWEAGGRKGTQASVVFLQLLMCL